MVIYISFRQNSIILSDHNPVFEQDNQILVLTNCIDEMLDNDESVRLILNYSTELMSGIRNTTKPYSSCTSVFAV